MSYFRERIDFCITLVNSFSKLLLLFNYISYLLLTIKQKENEILN